MAALKESPLCLLVNPPILLRSNHSFQLRLRVFAGPNGSGKSTVIQSVRQYESGGQPIDFGYYINADDITVALKNKGIAFKDFDCQTTTAEFTSIAQASGLINKEFPEDAFLQCFKLTKNRIVLYYPQYADRLAQVIADFLRKKLLAEEKRFSFETVFSHKSKLDIMRQAAGQGYKVYLYFVSTESPEINKFRVVARKAKGGHDVPPDKIESRYYRSLKLLYDACELSYQVFFFDNSVAGEESRLIAHFKKIGNKKQWDKMKKKNLPEWFKTYYLKHASASAASLSAGLSGG